jgi:hypothetical protein
VSTTESTIERHNRENRCGHFRQENLAFLGLVSALASFGHTSALALSGYVPILLQSVG